MTNDERKLLLLLARWATRREQEEADRLDLSPFTADEMRRMIALVSGAAPPPEQTVPPASLARFSLRVPS